jgi:hypothetical protein
MTTPIRWSLLVLVVVLLGASHAQEKKPAPKPPEKKPTTVMQRKLAHAQKVLEGLALNDFDKIGTNAGDLMQCAQEAGWKLVKTARYDLYSNDFVRHLEGLKKAAKNKNVDAAALAYVEITLTCVKCHQYVREEKIGLAPELAPPGSRTGAAE